MEKNTQTVESNLLNSQFLLQVIPFVKREEVFALKGGTAINFFYQDLPRLSVDIDLCYLPVQPRRESLQGISDAMNRVGESVGKTFNAKVTVKTRSELNTTGAILIQNGLQEIKIEPNFVLRGNVLPTEDIELCKEAQKLIDGTVSMKTLSKEEVYAGKVCAALDRQLPRDLFDIKYMFENVGFTEKLKNTFLVYLVCQGRPFEEILQPNRIPYSEVGLENLKNLKKRDYTVEELSSLRENLIQTVNFSLKDKDKEFLLSLMTDKPRFDLGPFEGLDRFPGVQWKLLNIKRMDRTKRRQALEKLEDCFKSGREREL